MRQVAKMPARYLRNPDIVCREEPFDQWLFFNPDTNNRRFSNAVGAAVWHLCDGTRDLSQIVQEICQTFEGVPLDDVTGDIAALLQSMEAEGFISRIE